MNFEWDPEKDEEIQQKHGISFEEVVNLMGRGFLLKVARNPSPKHKGQKIFLVQKDNAVFVVPYEKYQGKYRLITAFYSQHYTNNLLR